jgi:hypothetical protein
MKKIISMGIIVSNLLFAGNFKMCELYVDLGHEAAELAMVSRDVDVMMSRLQNALEYSIRAKRHCSGIIDIEKTVIQYRSMLKDTRDFKNSLKKGK